MPLHHGGALLAGPHHGGGLHDAGSVLAEGLHLDAGLLHPRVLDPLLGVALLQAGLLHPARVLLGGWTPRLLGGDPRLTLHLERGEGLGLSPRGLLLGWLG